MINLIEQAELLEDSNKKKKKLILLLLLSIGLTILFIFFQFFQSAPDPQQFIAGDILPDGRHAAEIAQIMQDAVDESQVTIQINTVMNFETPTSYGNIGIINPSINIFPIAVDFVLDETGEVIFTSGAIFPNEFVSNVRLDVQLPVGVHQATAVFNAYDAETFEHVWKSNIALTINIGQ